MNLDEFADDAKKENIVAIVAMMSKIDGKIHENEFVYLLKLGESLGMDAESVRRSMAIKEAHMYIPKSEEERITILYYLIFLIKIDSKVENEESDLFYFIGLKLGFNHLMIANFIKIVKSNIDKKLPPNVLIEEMKKYLN